MRKDNVPESDMNSLFTRNQEIVEEMFASADNRDAVGAFEGAIYQAKGYYRSEMNCIMFTRTSLFCQVCSDAIEKVIDEYSKPATD